jgi:hypothetical protein
MHDRAEKGAGGMKPDAISRIFVPRRFDRLRAPAAIATVATLDACTV